MAKPPTSRESGGAPFNYELIGVFKLPLTLKMIVLVEQFNLFI